MICHRRGVGQELVPVRVVLHKGRELASSVDANDTGLSGVGRECRRVARDGTEPLKHNSPGRRADTAASVRIAFHSGRVVGGVHGDDVYRPRRFKTDKAI